MRTSMNISLPSSLKTWVEKQVDQGGYTTASEYVRDVLRREHARSRIDAKLTHAINSGTSSPMKAQDWQRIRTEGLKRAGKFR